jgi:sugar/nucleoside kinase (ribokinase family)
MKRNGITAAGTWSVDYTKVISQFPREGSCTSILSETVDNGGAPYNLLVDLCRLGVRFPLRAVGRVGQDLDGASIIKDCKAHDFDTTRLKAVPEATTSFSDVVISHESGVRTSFHHSGANGLLSLIDFDFEKDTSRIFYLGSLFFLPSLDAPDERRGTQAATLLAAARKQGLLTCVDIERTNIDPEVFKHGGHSALQETDLIVLNVEVAELLTGQTIRSRHGVEMEAAFEAAAMLLAYGHGQCAVIRFPAGAIALTANGEKSIEGSVNLPKHRLISAAGSGHAFTAGFLCQYHDKRPLGICLQSAHAIAAACLLDRSASAGIKPLATCLGLIDQFGQRNLYAMTASV